MKPGLRSTTGVTARCSLESDSAVLGYNPKKHRRPSQHPLPAALDENRAVVHSWLRSGNTAGVTGEVEFLGEALTALPGERW